MSEDDDWSRGAYEVIAPTLVPAAEQLVHLAAPRAGERAIDLGAGSGNASVLLAERGADVTAIDPSLRLLGVAERRAVHAGLSLHTLVGSAESMPLPAGDADLIVSNFGMVFSDEPDAALTEVLRVLAPGGRLLYTAWLPTGPIFEVSSLLRAELDLAPTTASPAGLADATARDDAPEAAARIDWHVPSTFADRIPGGAAAITTHSGSLEFAGATAAAWIEEMTTHQPMWLAAREQIGDEERWIEIAERLTTLLEGSSRGGDGFAVHSPYVAVEIWPRD